MNPISLSLVRHNILYLNKSFWLQSCLYRDFIYFLNLQLNMFGYFHVLIMMYNFILFFVVLIMTLIWIWNFNCRPNTTNSLFLMSMVHNMHPTTLNMNYLFLINAAPAIHYNAKSSRPCLWNATNFLFTISKFYETCLPNVPQVSR